MPRAGYPVVDADGAVIGEVTSGAPSPTLGKPIAMAYVDAAHAAPGTAGVAVDIRGSREPYEVVALPFYKRDALTPRGATPAPPRLAAPVSPSPPRIQENSVMSNPQQLRYSKEHEWLSAAEDGVADGRHHRARGRRPR